MIEFSLLGYIMIVDVQLGMVLECFPIDMYTTFRMEETFQSKRQPQISDRKRSVLVSWLKEIYCEDSTYHIHTLHLAVHLLDRYLQQQKVICHDLQLVGVACFWIAYKYDDDEFNSSDILTDLVDLCDGACERHDVSTISICVEWTDSLKVGDILFFTNHDIQVMEMEWTILKKVDYRLAVQTCITFSYIFLQYNDYHRSVPCNYAPSYVVSSVCYILDGTLISYKLLRYLPSQLAVAALYITRRCFGFDAWNSELRIRFDYWEDEIIPVAIDILQEHKKNLPYFSLDAGKYSIPSKLLTFMNYSNSILGT